VSVVVVTGASGFVGANLVRHLASTGDDVHLLLRPQSKAWRLDGFSAYQRHDIDLSDTAALTALFNELRPDAVLHLAAYGAYASQADVRFAVRTNVESAIALMEAARAAGVARFLNAGSSSEYGYKDHAPDEYEAVAPNSLYAVTKVAATNYGRYLAASAGFHVTTLRLYSVYGPFEEPTRLIPTLIVRGADGTLPPLVSPATARDYIYVDDVVAAFAAIRAADIPPGNVYNVGSGRQTSIAEVVALVRDRFGIRDEPQWGTMSAKGWDTDIWIANAKRIGAEVGWRATTPFSEGFERTAAWLMESADRRSFYTTTRALPQ
jgi:nucleoside-diphosphate-sugar epimerase